MLSGCIGDWDRKLDEKKIDTQIAGNSSVFSTKNVRLNIREYKQILYITLDYKVPKNFSFPVDSFYGDTLTETRFFLQLKCNGTPVVIDERVAGYSGFSGTVADTNCFIIPFNKRSLRTTYHDEIQLPLTVFHTLKKGKQRFEGELFAKTFYGTHYDTTTSQSETIEMPCNIIHGQIKFILDIPEIYLTTLYGYGLELRNDETFSPRGMDFSFREGYPDVYWEIYSPAYSEDDFSSPYWRSHEATFSTGYHEFDTIYLYHFSPTDCFKIGVYDRDDLSRNDFLGNWYGSIKEFETDSSKTIKFDNLAWFRMKAVQKGCINK
jgi:hypothetical protein